MFQFVYETYENCQIVVGVTICLFIVTPLYIIKYFEDCFSTTI